MSAYHALHCYTGPHGGEHPEHRAQRPPLRAFAQLPHFRDRDDTRDLVQRGNSRLPQSDLRSRCVLGSHSTRRKGPYSLRSVYGTGHRCSAHARERPIRNSIPDCPRGCVAVAQYRRALSVPWCRSSYRGIWNHRGCSHAIELLRGCISQANPGRGMSRASTSGYQSPNLCAGESGSHPSRPAR